MKDSDLAKFIISAGVGFVGASVTANLLSNGFGVSSRGGGIVLPTKPHDGLIGLQVKMNGVSLTSLIDSGSRRVTTSKETADRVGLKNFPTSVTMGENIYVSTTRYYVTLL